MPPRKRRRITSARRPRSPFPVLYPPTPAHIWLEQLPPDVLSAILNPIPDLLPVALASRTMSKLVCNHLNHLLVMGDKNTNLWCSIHSPNIKHVIIARRLYKKPPLYILPYLQTPSITTAVISDNPSYLQALQHTNSVTDLTINYTAQLSFSDILRHIRSLPLSSLTLKCPSSAPCLFDTSRDLYATSLHTACPHVKSIDVSCHHHWDFFYHPLWPLLLAMHSVTDVTIRAMFNQRSEIIEPPALFWPEDVIQWLARKKAVHLHDVSGYAVDAISPLGKVLKTLSFCTTGPNKMHWNLLNANHYQTLQSCTQLEHLNMRVKAGCDDALAKFIMSLNSLKTLELRWDYMVPFVGMRKVYERFRPILYGYFDVEEGLLLKAIQSCVWLKELRLVRVRISVNEMVSILETTGENLRLLETSITDQKETPFDRLAVLIETIGRCNRDLHQFFVQEKLFWSQVKLDATLMDLEEAAWQGKRLLYMVLALERKMPLLTVNELKSGLRKLFDKSYGNVAYDDGVNVTIGHPVSTEKQAAK